MRRSCTVQRTPTHTTDNDMAPQKLYIAKFENGEETEPVEQDVLIKLAENGTITATTMIRSKLIPEWNKAGNVDFLKAIIFRQQQDILQTKALSKSAWQRFCDRITLTAPQAVMNKAGGLVQTRPEMLPKATPGLRLLAGLTDGLVIVICLAALYFGGTQLRAHQILADGYCVLATLAAMLLFYLCYFTLQIGLGSNQTIGQRLWGIQLIRTNGKPFWMARVYLYALFLLPSMVLAPVFILPGLRTIPEMLTATRLAKVLVPR